MKFIYDSGLAINFNFIKQFEVVESFSKENNRMGWIILITKSSEGINKDTSMLNSIFDTKKDAEDCLKRILISLEIDGDRI